MRTQREPTGAEATAILDVQELAFRYELGQVTLSEIKAATSGKQRWLATRFTPPDDPAFRPLMAMLDALIAERGELVATDYGTMELAQLLEARLKIVHATKDELERIGIDAERGEVICLPIRWPWTIRPDPKRGIEGQRGEPVYRPREQWGQAEQRTFRVKTEPSRTYDREWWEANHDERDD